METLKEKIDYAAERFGFEAISNQLIEESREAAVDRYVVKTNLKIQDMYWRKHKR